VAYLCICITLNEQDFQAFCRIVKSKLEESYSSFAEHSKRIFIKTPAEGICFILKRAEAKNFTQILEEANNEIKALSLISLLIHKYLIPDKYYNANFVSSCFLSKIVCSGTNLNLHFFIYS
jgi:hypothetical protein